MPLRRAGSFYADYTKHRVWMQVMVFSPRSVVKNFHNLALFHDDITEKLAAGAVVK